MASLATVSQAEQRANNSVVYPAWDRQSFLSPLLNYRSHEEENEILSGKNEYVTVDEEVSFERQPTRSLNLNSNVVAATTTDFEAHFHEDPLKICQEDFLEKLSQLRMAHKKTLDSWKRLYEENVDESSKKGKKNAAKLTSSGAQYAVHKIDIEYDEEDPIENIHCGSEIPVDTNTNFPRKNPSPRRGKSSISFNNETVKKNLEKNFVSENSDPPRYYNQNLKEESWRDLNASARSVQEEPRISILNSTNNIRKIGLSSDSSSDHYSHVNTELLDEIYGLDEDGVDDNDSWHHRLTIPEPFNMTKREEINRTKKKSRTLIEYEKQREEKRKVEEEECSKEFKASPVPDHVFMPLYEDIRKKDELRRSMVKEQTKEFLRSQEKPFSFAQRDNEKQELDDEYHSEQEEEEVKNFKANPIPKAILDTWIDEKLKVDANMREVKRRLRSVELLRTSSIPKGMEFRQKLMEQKLKSKAREKQKNHNPTIHTVPDYEALHKQFQKDLMKKRKVIESTNVRPFTFRTSELVRQREKKEKHSEDYQYESDAGSLRLRRSYSFPDCLHTIPAKTTTSTELRAQANRDKITKLKKNAANTERIPKPKDNFLKKEIQLKISANDQKLQNKKSTPKYREQQKNYSRQLQEMRERLEKRPLLFEQVEKNNVKSRAEKKFKETLRDFGLDESFVTEGLSSPSHRRASFPRPKSTDNYKEYEEHEVHGEKWEKTKRNITESSNHKDLFPSHSSKSSHYEDYSPCPSGSGSEDSDNEQESGRSEF